jgi:hypothetical protein
MQRSRLESILNVAHSENKLSRQLGWAGKKCYASGYLLDDRFEPSALSTLFDNLADMLKR